MYVKYLASIAYKEKIRVFDGIRIRDLPGFPDTGRDRGKLVNMPD